MKDTMPLRKVRYESIAQLNLECMLSAAATLSRTNEVEALKITAEALIEAFDKETGGNATEEYASSFWARIGELLAHHEALIETAIQKVANRRWRTYFLQSAISVMLANRKFDEAVALIPRMEFNQSCYKVKTIQALCEHGEPEDLEQAIRFFADVRDDAYYRELCISALAQTDLTEMEEQELARMCDPATARAFKNAVGKIRRLKTA